MNHLKNRNKSGRSGEIALALIVCFGIWTTGVGLVCMLLHKSEFQKKQEAAEAAPVPVTIEKSMEQK